MGWDGVRFEKNSDSVKDPLFTNWATHSLVVGKPKSTDPHYQEDKNKLRLCIEAHVKQFLADGGVIEKLPPKPDNEIRAEIKTQWLDNR